MDDVGELLRQSPPIHLQDIHMLYGNEGFDGRSREPENWEDELNYGGRIVFHPGLNRYLFLFEGKRQIFIFILIKMSLYVKCSKDKNHPHPPPQKN